MSLDGNGDQETAQAAETPSDPPPPVAGSAQTAADSSKPAPLTPSPLQQEPVIITHVTFDVLRARVPRGFFSESGKVWNHLDEEVIPADRAASLNRNGFRVARGHVDAWPPIKALLETQPHVQTSRSRLTMNNGLPLLLELDQAPRDQTAFMYRPDGTLVGARWPGSSNLIRIEYGIAPTKANTVIVEVMPQIRQDGFGPEHPLIAGRTTAGAGPPQPPSLVLRQLAFQMEMDRDQFLAIGPSATTTELPYSIGSLLLCDEDVNGRFESMYFITPRVSRSGGAGGT